jgi:hypothetical protein
MFDYKIKHLIYIIMVVVALIKKNRCNFDDIEQYAEPLLYRLLDQSVRTTLKARLNEYLWSVVEPFIEFIDIGDDQETMQTKMSENLASPHGHKQMDELFYHGEMSYTFPKRVMEVMYAEPVWEDYVDNWEENMNNIASLFSLKHTVIQFNSIIMTSIYDLSAPKYLSLTSTTKEDILRVIRRRYFNTAVVIRNNAIDKYYYQDPKYLVKTVFNLNDTDNIEHLSFTHLKYNLVYYCQNNPNEYVNSIATRICGLRAIHGDVVMLHEMEEDIFANISVREAKRLNVLSYGASSEHVLQPEELVEQTEHVVENGEEKEKKVSPFWSRYIVAERRMKLWQLKKNKCMACQNEISIVFTCQKCFRMKYCSEECIRTHVSDCLPLN